MLRRASVAAASLVLLAVSVVAHGAGDASRAERRAEARRRWRQPPAEEAWVREARAKLERALVTVSFDGVPITAAVREIAKQTGVNALVDPDLVAKEGDVPVRLALTDFSGLLALEWIGKLVAGGVTFHRGVALVTFEERCRNLVTRVYDLRSILAPAADNVPPGIDLAGVVRPGRETPPLETDDAISEARGGLTAQLVAETIMQKVAPGTWGAEYGAFLNAHRSALVIRHRPEVHDRIRDYLEWFDGTVNLQVRAELRVVSLDEGLATRLLASNGGAAGTVYLSAAQLAAIDDALAARRRARLVRVANVGCYNAQRASVLDGTTRDEDDHTSFRGWVFDVMPFASFDRRYVRLDVRISRYAAARGGVGVWRFDCTTRCLDGDTVMVGAATAPEAGGERGRRLVVLVTPRILYLEPGAPPAETTGAEDRPCARP